MPGGWERLAAFEGGTVSWLTTATAADGAEHVFAATPVGVFRSLDRGLTWSPLDAEGAVAGAEVVAASPRYAEDGIVFVGARDGLFRLPSGGPRDATAGRAHLLSNARVLALAVLPGEGSHLTLLAGTEDDGVLVSRDGGRDWTGANPGLLDLTILALAVSPTFLSDGLAFAATPSGLFWTRNGAESWRIVDLDWDDVAVQCLAVSPGLAEDRVVLAGTEEHGLLRSEDAGRSWEQVPDLADVTFNGLSFLADGRVVAATDAGVARSDDHGETWRLVGEDLGGVAGAVICGRGAETVLLAGLPVFGIVRSVYQGRAWTPSNTGLTASLRVGVLISPDFEQDQTLFTFGLQAGLNVSHDAGETWADCGDTLFAQDEGIPEDAFTGIYGLTLGRSASGERVLYAGKYAHVCFSTDDGLHWTPVHAANDPPWPTSCAEIVVTGHHDARTVAAVLQGGCVRSADLLISSPDGVTFERVIEPFGRSTEVFGLAISPNFAADGVLFAATGLATHSRDQHTPLRLMRSADRGRRWDLWLELAVAPGGSAVQVVALPPNPWGDTLLVGAGGQVHRPRPNAWAVSGGRRRPVWDAVDVAGDHVAAAGAAGRLASLTGLAASPEYAADRTLFASTSGGIYVSRDGGATFEPWSEELEPLAMVAVAPSPSYARDRLVFALGLGGTVWRRRDP
jgi:photosystem II stability/assembly factor-like uncharacterized protein